MELWSWYDRLMGNNISLAIGVVLTVVVVTWWEKLEEKWRKNDTYGLDKKILKVIGVILIAIFGLPGIIVFFGSV